MEMVPSIMEFSIIPATFVRVNSNIKELMITNSSISEKLVSCRTPAPRSAFHKNTCMKKPGREPATPESVAGKWFLILKIF